MLVKLGDVWVDPTKVIIMEPGMSVSILTEGRCSMSAGNINDFAEIINKALSTQTFGGDNEEKVSS